MKARTNTAAILAISIAFAIVATGCGTADDSAATTTEALLTTTLPPATTTTLAPTTTTLPPATTTTMPPTTTTTAPPTTTTTVPAIVFPMWRLPTHGEDSAVAYVAYAPFGAADAAEKMAEGHSRLDEIGLDLWEGYGSLSCDAGAEAALGLEDGLSLGVYYDTPAEAHAFADAWAEYFGEPVVGVVELVTTFCLD